ncbi:MAG: hypothetical protein JEY96_16885 [Bacteroidales bacterium]|nr:hypothetical protein [Bacteroidales bacterium]
MTIEEIKQKYPSFYKRVEAQKPVSVSLFDYGIGLNFADGRERRTYYIEDIEIMEKGLNVINKTQ